MTSRTPHAKPGMQTAQLVLACENLVDNMAFFIDDLGFQLESISPADSPRVATLSAPGLRIRLVPGDEPVDSVTIRMPRENKPDNQGYETAPNGTRIEFYDPDPGSQLPGIKQSYVLSSLSASSTDDQWIRGRAGMLYRDLIPNRQNGRFIASHIKILDGGNIEDYPHFHDVRFQMIYCFKGWVRLVYEDQGEEFILKAGDCVLQPPMIRHQVLESSDGLEVIEIGCPAHHETFADNDMRLPTSVLSPGKDFSGQQFVRFERNNATWSPWRLKGFESAEFGFITATAGMAAASIVRPGSMVGNQTPEVSSHGEEFLFIFVLKGCVSIACEGEGIAVLNANDACVIPCNIAHAIMQPSDELEMLEVRLSGEFLNTREIMSYQAFLEIL